MATITSTASGDYGTGATWVGGIAPVEGDKVVIAVGHTVTVAGTYIAGDDSTTAFTVNGTLKASRVANSSLTIKGDIVTAASTSATIDYGRLSTADPIPSTYTATLILNYSASMVNNKYGLFVADTSNFYACGATRTINARLTADLAASGTSATVDDITGWAVGDRIIFAPSSGTVSHYDKKTILTITPGAGTTGTITFSAVTYAHASNCPIGNYTSNVTIKNYNTTNYAYACFRHTSTASNSRREVDYVNFERVQSDTSLVNTKVFISSSSLATVTTPFATFSNNFFYNCASGTGIFIYQWNSGGFYLDELGFFTDDGTSGGMLYAAAGSYAGIKNSVWYYHTGSAILSGFSQGGQGFLFTDNTFCALNTTNGVNWTNGDGAIFTRCAWHSIGSGASSYVSMNCGSAEFTNCNFGYRSTIVGSTPALWGTCTPPNIFSTILGASRFSGLMNDCYYGTPTTGTFLQTATANPQWVMIIANKNLDPLVQEIYTPQGTIVRDNTTKVSGVTSLKMSPTSSTNALTFDLYVPAPTGNKVGVSGYLWRDTANVCTVTLSGLGITESTYTASGTLSANEQFFVSGTQTTGTDGFFKLTISTVGTTGNVWVDAVSAPQGEAIDFGEFGYWNNGLPAQIISASYVSPADVWNFLASNATLAGSMGKKLKSTWTALYGRLFW